MDNGYAASEPSILRTTIRSPSTSTQYLDYLISLVRQPLPSMAGRTNSPLPRLYEAGSSRFKAEDMDVLFTKAAAHLHMKSPHNVKHTDFTHSSPPSACDTCGVSSQHLTSAPGAISISPHNVKHADFVESSLSACDGHGVRSQQAVSAPGATANLPHHAMEMMVASTSHYNAHLNSSSYMTIPSKVHAQSTLSLRDRDSFQAYEPNDESYSQVSPTSFSDIMLRAMEISEASESRLLSTNNRPAASVPSCDAKVSFAKEISSTGSPYQNLPVSFRSDLPEPLQSMAGECPNSPSKQDSPVMSADDSDADCKQLPSNINIIKRRNGGHRKAQQRRVVCVPLGENKHRGLEAPPSDMWTWRKYGQKPIKGSPFPRGYYRCSSSKGCPARKQVERSRNDPSMVMVTYTADHNHPWPLNRSSNSSKPESNKEKKQAMEETRTTHHQKSENLFSNIINPPDGVEEQVVSSIDPLDQDEESFLLQRDVDLCLTRTNTLEGDDVFDNLGELPELSAIFNKGYVEELVLS